MDSRLWCAALNMAAARCTSFCQLNLLIRMPKALACRAVLNVSANQKPSTLQAGDNGTAANDTTAMCSTGAGHKRTAAGCPLQHGYSPCKAALS